MSNYLRRRLFIVLSLAVLMFVGYVVRGRMVDGASDGPPTVDLDNVTWNRAGSQRLPDADAETATMGHDVTCDAVGHTRQPVLGMPKSWVSVVGTMKSEDSRLIDINSGIVADADHIERWKFSARSRHDGARVDLYVRYIPNLPAEDRWMDAGNVGRENREWYPVAGSPFPAFLRLGSGPQSLVLVVRLGPWKIDVSGLGVTTEELLAVGRRAVAACAGG